MNLFPHSPKLHPSLARPSDEEIGCVTLMTHLIPSYTRGMHKSKARVKYRF